MKAESRSAVHLEIWNVVYNPKKKVVEVLEFPKNTGCGGKPLQYIIK
jgi:hypothetical protein